MMGKLSYLYVLYTKAWKVGATERRLNVKEMIYLRSIGGHHMYGLGKE